MTRVAAAECRLAVEGYSDSTSAAERLHSVAMNRLAATCLASLSLAACTAEAPEPSNVPPAQRSLQAAAYLDNSGRPDVIAGGVRMIQISTPKGPYKVWTKRVGNNPRIKVLLLHGGPAATH